jgi:Flp pilus assembly protein TadG
MRLFFMIRPKSEQGQSLTELAIILVFLLVLLAGVVDLGRAFFAYIIVRDAAQEGALIGALHADDSNLDTLVKARVETAFIDPLSPENTPLDISNLVVTTSVIGDPCAGVHQDVTDHDQDGNTSEIIPNGILVNIDYKIPITMPLLGTIIGSQEINMSTSIENTTMSPRCE